MNSNTRLAFPLAAIAAALLSVYGPARADAADDMRELTQPESSLRLGAGLTTAAAPRFGQYTGLRKDDGVYGLLDLNLVKRDDATGTWTKVQARDFGLHNRELRVNYARQGDWSYTFDFNQTPRYEPHTVNTSLTGVGTVAQGHSPAEAPRADVQLKTQRQEYGLGFSKQLGNGVDVRLSARTEDKDGARRWGHAANFLTDPINSTTRQYEGSVGYRGDKLWLSAGYYGSTYSNQNAAVLVAGTAFPMALPQDNESHQLYLSGGYAITPSTRATFKAASTRATQNERFTSATSTTSVPLAGAPDSLNGKVDTTLLQMGLTARPLPKLALLANLRYEDRDDKTPRVQYIDASASRDGFNVPMSRKLFTGKAEASYQLPMQMRLTGGVDVEHTTRSVAPTLRQISWRAKNDETAYRLELRRSLSDTLNGALAYVKSARGGSDYLAANNNGAADVIDPIHWADRKRDKVRLSADWQPAEALSVQFMLDASNDRYEGRALGPNTGRGRLYSIDASYAFSEAWQATAWVSRDENRMIQSTISGANAALVPAAPAGSALIWQAQLGATGNALGFGVRGKPNFKWQVGADLQFVDDTNEYDLTKLSAATGSLPVINNKTASLKLYGVYALAKNTSLRLDYVYDRRTTNDWTWTNWVYADGTTLRQDPNQNVQFIAVSYNRKF